MPTIHLRAAFAVDGLLDWTEEELGPPRAQSKFTFTIAAAYGAVSIDVVPAENDIAAFLAMEMSKAAIDSLSEWRRTRRIPSQFHPEVQQAVDSIEGAVGQLVDVLRFTYPLTEFRGVRLAGISRSEDGNAWQDERRPLRMYTTGRMWPRRVDEGSAPTIQAQLDAGVRPLLALRHWQRACDESDPRHQWIEAAIAAELGVKEFLVRHQPVLADILLQLPSPPVNKLYGALLEAYAGGRSPWVSDLAKGAERRNRLVHRPAEPSPEVRETWQYINTVDAALHDLMSRLYPADETIAALARDAASAAERGSKRRRGT